MKADSLAGLSEVVLPFFSHSVFPSPEPRSYLLRATDGRPYLPR